MIAIRSRRPSTAGVVNMAGVLLVLALVISLALKASGTTPPAIAEFAPQAQQIKQAPQEQTSVLGRGPNGAGVGAASPSPSPSQAPLSTGSAVISRCVGDPPRQIEDPQSPPCVAFWSGNNGGRTWGGVTASQVRIAIPVGAPPPGQAPALSREQVDLQNFFNQRFELYGRHLTFFPVPDQGNHADNPPVAAMRADADGAAAQDPFASADYPDNGGAEIVYYDELAQKKVLSVADESAAREGEAYVDSHAPYEWRLLPGLDILERNLGEWICKSFAGRNSFHAGPGSNGLPRKFGLLVTDYTDGFSPDYSALNDALAACNVKPYVQTDQYTVPDNGAADTAMVRFKTAGDTTLICICEAGDMWLSQMPAAERQNYYPEWLISSFGGGPDWDLNAQAFGNQDTAEFKNQLGLSFYNKSVPTAELPVVWAIHEVDPGDTIPDLAAHSMQKDYDGLLILAAGIQMAGPDLTPQSFQSALFRTAFPDPGAGGPPYYQARVGFGAGHHHFFQDSAPIWWSSSDQSTWGQQGAWCWSAHGVRYALGDWPGQDAAQTEGREPCY